MLCYVIWALTINHTEHRVITLEVQFFKIKDQIKCRLATDQQAFEAAMNILETN